MQHNSILYTILFSIAVCVVCSILVSASAVGLKDRQNANKLLYRQKNVLIACGLVEREKAISPTEIRKIFDERIRPRVITLKTGEYVDTVDAKTFDQRKAREDLSQSQAAPDNAARVRRIPNQALVYEVMKDNAIAMVVLPIEGYGLWSTMYGFLALDKDTISVKGITYYDQQETPGLGGEIENPRWTALWSGRKAYDENWKPALAVIKGPAGPPDQDPHHIDGLSGATITSRGVTHTMDFWLGENGFAPYLKRLREQGGA